MKKEISVIIPVYNCDTTLRTCIDSICCQTIDKNQIELLLIDDKSTDRSWEICQEYAERYPFIQAFQLAENSKGASAPRNKGLDHATGTYVFFIDSDDWLGEDCLRRLLAHAEASGSDYVRGRSVLVNRFRKKNLSKLMENDVSTYENLHFDRDELATELLVCWAVLMKRDMIERNAIRFPEGIHYYEDHMWSMQVMHAANNIYIANDYDYYLLRRDKGTPSIVTDKRLTYYKRPENLYYAFDQMLLIAEDNHFPDDHLFWKKFFEATVRNVITYTDEAALAEPDTYPDSGNAFKEKTWNRVRGHYSPWVRSHINLDLVVWYDSIEAGLGYAQSNTTLRYYAELPLDEELMGEALGAIPENILPALDLPSFLSNEARKRLIAAQAISCRFYSEEISNESAGILSGHYFLPLKVIDDFSMELHGLKPDMSSAVTLSPQLWGEEYQEIGTWVSEIDREAVKELSTVEIRIMLQGECIAKAVLLPWDAETGQPKRVSILRRRLMNTQKKLDKSQKDLEKTKAKLSKTKEKLSKSKDEITKMKNSKSWKLTKPLRQVAGHNK